MTLACCPRSSWRPSGPPVLSPVLLQVNLVLGDGRSLGLTIRGGAEYGLGIYVTGVDPGSEAESSGLKVSGPRLPWGDGRGAACVRAWAVRLMQPDFQQSSQHPP